MATDVDLSDRRVAAEMPPDRAVEILSGALELVHGKVLSRPSRASDSFAWIDVEI